MSVIQKTLTVDIDLDKQEIFNLAVGAGPLTRMQVMLRIANDMTDEEIGEVKDYLGTLAGFSSRLRELAARCDAVKAIPYTANQSPECE